MKKLLGLIFILCALGSNIFAVHELRTPLCLTSKLNNVNGSFHYPISPLDECKTNVDVWAGAYCRNACDGYCPKTCDWCCSKDCDSCITYACDMCSDSCSSCGCNNSALCSGTVNYLGCTSCPGKKVPLAELFFGKAEFTGSDAFAQGTTFDDLSSLETVIMKPKIDYKEEGVVLGMHVERRLENKKWRVGFNANLPIKHIQVTRHYDCDNCCGAITQPVGGPQAFFNDKGVYLCDSECVTGVGDFDTALFFGYDLSDRSYFDVVGGVKFPTGDKNTCPSRVYYIPTGNNGHFEAKIGLEGGWRSKRWFGIRMDASYTHALEATEKRAATFNCEQVRGIGPCIDAKVKWGYFLGHLDMTIFHPENQNMGFALGYEIYYKRHDKVKFCTCAGGDMAEDFLGNVVTLDSRVVTKNTDILAHKLRGQMFHRWEYFELYLGATKVVDGWNGMAENELHIGCGINF